MRYLILNLAVLSIVLIVLLISRRLKFNKLILKVIAILLITTAIFDSLLIAAGIFSYNEAVILNIYIGKAPIEDFFYAILAGILIPGTWIALEQKND